jgi:hypothetical protein
MGCGASQPATLDLNKVSACAPAQQVLPALRRFCHASTCSLLMLVQHSRSGNRPAGCPTAAPANPASSALQRSSGRVSEITKIGTEWTGHIPAGGEIVSSKELTPAVGGAGALQNGGILVGSNAQDAAVQPPVGGAGALQHGGISVGSHAQNATVQPETGKAAAQQQLHSATRADGALQNGGISTSSHATDAAVPPELGKAATQQQLHAAMHTSNTPVTNIAAATQSTEALALTLQPHPAHVNGVATPPIRGSSPPATPTKPDSVPREPERDYQPDEDLGDLAFPAAAGVEGESGSPKKAPVAAAIAAINAGAAASPRCLLNPSETKSVLIGNALASSTEAVRLV